MAVAVTVDIPGEPRSRTTATEGAAMSTPLRLDVFVVPYKPIVGLIAPMGEGEATGRQPLSR
jgi:hypothetical protein